MEIKWFNAKERFGSASLYLTNITLNTVAAVPFEYAYRVQVGIDDKRNVLIHMLSKDNVLRGDLDEYSLLKISVKNTYARISSTEIMKRISDETKIVLSNKPIKYNTSWDDTTNILTIFTGGEK